MSSVPCDLGAYTPGTGGSRADALFASALQRSDEPSPGQVRQAIAVTRMRWVRTIVARAVPAACLAA
jgi:hypothetical protein